MWLVVSFGTEAVSRCLVRRCTTVSRLCISTEGRTFTRSAHRSREPNERLPPHISSQIRPATERPLLAEPGSHPTVSLRLGILRSWGASHPARERLVHDALQSCISFSRCVSLHLALSSAERCRAESSASHVALYVPASGIMPACCLHTCSSFHASASMPPHISCRCISLYLVVSLYLAVSRCLIVQL